MSDQPGCPCSICEERSLRDRIAAALWSHGWGVHTHGAEQDEGLACRERLVDGKLRGECYWRQADAVIAVVSDEYINSRGMFHEPDRCLGCEECNEYDPYEAKADAERQQWADDEGLPND